MSEAGSSLYDFRRYTLNHYSRYRQEREVKKILLERVSSVLRNTAGLEKSNHVTLNK